MRAWWLEALLLQVACGDPAARCDVGYVCEVAGTGELGFNRDGLTPEMTDLYLVSAVRRGPDGRIYLMDFNNQRLRVIQDDGLVQTIVGDGFHAFTATTGVPATESPLGNPIDFDFLPDGRLVFVSYHDPRVLVLDADNTLHALAGTGDVGTIGNEGDGGPALSAQFIQLDGIAVARDGAIYVSDSLAHRVRVIRDGMVSTVAGTGVPQLTGDGGPAIEASLHWPTALVLDAHENLIIADSENHVIRRLADDGTIATIAGSGARGGAGDGGPATSAELDEPDGVAVDGEGTLYIADRSNFRVRRVTVDGTIETIGGTGDKGWSGDGGPALDARFGFLARLSLDGDGLFVADQSNACARRITLR